MKNGNRKLFMFCPFVRNLFNEEPFLQMSDGTDRLNQGRRRNDYETLMCDEDPPPSR